MRKYIIELKQGETAYKTVNSNGTPMIQLLALAPYTEPDMEQVRKEAYQQGYEQGYKDGYNEPGKGKIQVGDEIETPSGLKGYVVNFTDDELVHYVSSEGRFGTMGTSAVSKTGRHFLEIAEVLQKMKES